MILSILLLGGMSKKTFKKSVADTTRARALQNSQVRLPSRMVFNKCVIDRFKKTGSVKMEWSEWSSKQETRMKKTLKR